MSVCVCLFAPFHVVYFEAYFAPTSRSRMSEFGILGEKCWKEVVSEWTIFVGMWSKIAAQKKFLFADFALQNIVETTLPGQRVYC